MNNLNILQKLAVFFCLVLPFLGTIGCSSGGFTPATPKDAIQDENDNNEEEEDEEEEDEEEEPPVERTSAYPDCYNPLMTTANTVAMHPCSWAGVALNLQSKLDENTALGASYWPSSHNTYNSTAYPGISSSGDPNQSLSIGDQLALGIREIEFDVHWYPHTASGGNAPVLCHARGASQNHFGCGSTDLHLRAGLLEIQSFLNDPENAQAVVMLDIENNLADFVPPSGSTANDGAHTLTANLIENLLGEFLYKPQQTGDCQALPLNISRADILAAGKNLIVVSNCGTNSTWRNLIFDFGPSLKQQAHTGFTAPSDCQSADFSTADYANKWIRLWEDNTNVGAATNPNLQPINANTLKNMNNCGVNTASLDELTVNDGRFSELVWSWAMGQPTPNNNTRLCAQSRADGRFESLACTAATPQGYACKTNNTWQIAAQSGQWSSGETACTTTFGNNARFAVPATAEENFALIQAKSTANVTHIWLNYAESVDVTGDWKL